MPEQSEPARETPTEWMLKLVQPWLSSTHPQISDLTRWLQGLGLPPVGHDDEPYLWLLRGLDATGDRYKDETELARRVAVLLDVLDRLTQDAPRRDQLIHNALWLGASLSCPDQLTEPLLRLAREHNLSGSWLGVPHRLSLTGALIRNQLTSGLRDSWVRLLTGQRDELVVGTPYDGFEGMLLMPQSPNTRGEPYIEVIGQALTELGHYLKSRPAKRREFRYLIERAISMYPDRPEWPRDLIQQADERSWPQWQVESLPTLCVPLTNTDETSGGPYIIWRELFEALRARVPLEEDDTLCGGLLVYVHIPDELAPLLTELAAKTEPDRAANPFESDTSARGILAHSLSEAARRAQAHVDQPDAEVIQAAHRHTLHKERLTASNGARLPA